MLSIVIPTLNEEKYLPLLLNSLASQTFRDFEVVVADANSQDKTGEIASSLGCHVIPGGMPGKGRNNGAAFATGEWLLFLDADVILPPDFLKAATDEIREKRLDVASCPIEPMTANKVDRLLHVIVNFYFKATQTFWPHAPGFCIFVKKEIHQAIKGFDEKIQLAEDHDYVLRAGRIARFALLKNTRIPVSVRRLEKDGRFNIGVKFFLAEAHLIFLGPIRSNIFNYKFGHF